MPEWDPRDHGANCDACPLRKRVAVPPELHPWAKILLVGQDPGAEEVVEGRPFVGPTGRLLAGILRDFGLDRDRDLSITNAKLCMSPASWSSVDAKHRQAYACCFPRLQREVQQANAVLIFGSIAVGLLYPPARTKKGKGLISAIRGYPLEVEGRPAVATFHPAAALPGREPGLQKCIRHDLSRLLRLSQGRMRWVEPDFLFDPSLDQLDSWLQQATGTPVAVDIETADLDYVDPVLRLVGLGTADSAVAVGFRSVERPVPREFNCPPVRAKERLRNFFGSARETKTALVGHNVNVFDAPRLARFGMPLPGALEAHDTLALHHTIYGEEPHSLDYVISMSDLDAPKHKPLTAGDAHESWRDDAEYSEYCMRDCVTTIRLCRGLMRQARAEGLLGVYNVDRACQRLCVGMQEAGIGIDVSERRRHSIRLQAKKKKAKEQAKFLLQRDDFKLSSNLQVRRFLYEECGIEPLWQKEFETKGGDPSTSKDVVYALIMERNLPPRVLGFLEVLLDYRLAEKYESTWVRRAVPADDGRIHPDWNIGPVTGRLRANGVQNVPDTRADLDSLRSMYVASDGNVLVGADLSQVELRLVAVFSGDEKWIEGFKRGRDVHKENAADVLGVPIDQIQKFQRTFVKNFIYRLLYGGGYKKACRQLQQLRDPRTGTRPYANFKEEEAEAMQNRLLTAHPALERWWNRCVETWERTGEIKTVRHGRRRVYLNGIYAGADEVRNEIINQGVQGTAADVVNDASAEVMDLVPWRLYGPGLIIQCHDELVAEVAEAHVERTAWALKRAMTTEIMGMPIPVEIHIGRRWSDLK